MPNYMRDDVPLRKLVIIFLLLIVVPIGISAARYYWLGDHRGNRQTADRSSAGLPACGFRPFRSTHSGLNGALPLNIVLSGFGSSADKPIWNLEAALKCLSCKKGRYAPPVHMIKLTERQEITSYKWVHPDDNDRR
jgi:hypothetical protein